MNTQYKNEEEKKVKGVVDVCFLIDATGSMQPCIDAIKDNIRSFIKLMTSPQEMGGVMLKDWRACVWGYRDYTYDPTQGTDPIVKNDFTRDVAELEQQLAFLEADGGGPLPESLLDALFEVCNMGYTEKGETPNPNQWRYSREAARCVIVMTDAPYHPTMELMPGAGVTDIITRLQEDRIRLSVFAPELECYYDLCQADKSVYMPIEVPAPEDGSDPDPIDCIKALRDYTSDRAHFEKVLAQLAKTLTQSGVSDTEEL